MKMIITENQQKNLNSYIRRLDRMYHEYLEQNWPKEELCGSPFSPELWDETKNGNVYDYFVKTNIDSLTSEILEEIFISKYGEEGDFGYDEYSGEHKFILDLLIKLGYEEKMRQYLYDTLNNC
jgi:hypothetical protein